MENIEILEAQVHSLSEKIATLKKGSDHWNDLVDLRNVLSEYIKDYYIGLHEAMLESSC